MLRYFHRTSALFLYLTLLIGGQEIFDSKENYKEMKDVCNRRKNCYDLMTSLKETISCQKSQIESLQERIEYLERGKNAPKFDAGTAVGVVTNQRVNEASGLCASRRHKDVIYTHNDSGGQNRIFAIDAKTGTMLATINIDGADSKDWEDIACGPCPDGSHCIYIGDIGGNVRQPGFVIYRVKEPDTLANQNVTFNAMLRYSWDEENSETLMVDANADVYLVSKVGPGKIAKVTRLPKSAWNTNEIVKVPIGESLAIVSETDDPVGGDVSVDGKQILLKMYGHIWYWSVEDDDIITTMTKLPVELPSRHERQGEAVCWDATGEGYYTLAEGANSTLWYFRPRTQYYPRSGNVQVIKKETGNSDSNFVCPKSTDADVKRFYVAFPTSNPGMQLIFTSTGAGWARIETPELKSCENISLDEGTTLLDVDKDLGPIYLHIENKGIYIETSQTVSTYLKVNTYRPAISAAIEYSDLGTRYIFSNPLIRIFTVVATSQQTTIKITLHPGYRKILYEGQHIAGENDVISVELDRLDTFSVASPYLEILANKPIALITGPSNRLSVIIPVGRLGERIVIPRIFSGLPYTIYSPFDDTKVVAETSENTAISYVMNTDDVDGGFVTERSHVLYSNKPISAVFTSSDGTLYFPPLRHFAYNYTCPLLGTDGASEYRNGINIIIQSDSIDGLTVNGETVANENIRETFDSRGVSFTYVAMWSNIRNYVSVKSKYHKMSVFMYEIVDGQRYNYYCV